MKSAASYPFYSDFKENKVTPIAHRFGIAAGRDAQNTIKALEAALELDYDYLETDANITKDGKVVFVHQSDREKDSQALGIPTSDQIRSLTYSQLIDAYPVGGEDIPLAEDILKKYRDSRFFIDPKEPEVCTPLGRLISSLDRETSVAIGAWARKRALETVSHAETPEAIPTCVGPLGIITLKFTPVFISSRYLESSDAASVQSPRKSFGLEVMNTKRVRQIHKAGGMAIVWTERDKLETENELQNLIDLGVDGIMADDIALLKSVIDSSN